MIASSGSTVAVMEKAGNDSIAGWLSLMPGYRVVCTIDEPASLFEEICRTSPEVVILDLSLGGDPSALDLVYELSMKAIPVQALVVADEVDPVVAELALAVGAAAFARRSCKEDILKSLRRILLEKVERPCMGLAGHPAASARITPPPIHTKRYHKGLRSCEMPHRYGQDAINSQ